MAITLVQSSTRGSYNGAGSQSANTSFAALPAIGNKIIVAVNPWTNGNGSLTATSVTDNQGHTYTKRVSSNLSTAYYVELWETTVTASSGTFTVTFSTTATSAAASDGYVQATEWSGLGVFDQAGTAGTNTVTATVTANTGTLAVANSLAVALSNAQTALTTTTSGYTNISNDTGGTIQCYSFDYKVTAATTAVSGASSVTNGGLINIGVWSGPVASGSPLLLLGVG